MELVFDSAAEMIDYLDGHKQYLYEDSKTESDRSWAGGHTWESWSKVLTTSAGASGLYAQVGRILELQEDLMEDLPLKNVQTRKRVPAYTGGRVNTRKMLTGQYSQARRKWAPAERPAPPSHAVIFLNADYSAATSHETMAMNTAAPLALANYLETEHGVMCEIWSVAVCSSSWVHLNEPWSKYSNGNECSYFIRLKSPAEQMQLEDVAAAVHPSWFRVLHFRAIETIGKPTWGYGYPGDTDTKAAKALTFAEAHKLKGHVVTPVGGHRGNLHNKQQAQEWLQKQFKLLNIIE